MAEHIFSETSGGPLSRTAGSAANYEGFPPDFFRRADESPDPGFYVMDRKVVHIDDGAITAVTRLYEELLIDGAVVLDLMSSWRSHLPEGRASRVVGLGMNLAEMEDNPQLDEIAVHDLNASPTLPYDNATFDAVVCCVSIQYSVKPLELFAEAARVLRPDGPFIVTFSNRCFPTKAIMGWAYSSDDEHCRIVKTYFARTPSFGEVTVENRSSGLPIVSSPLYAVWARRHHFAEVS